PLVGAVVLQGDRRLGEGYHAEYGGPHAEVVALQAAGERARGSTLVVTLEPCAHQGTTPPCTDAILAAGVKRVVAAIRDPDPQAGGGLDVLRETGVEVTLGPMAPEAAALNAPFLFSREQADRPFVALKLATSVDGGIADATGSSRWVSGEAARDYVPWLGDGLRLLREAGIQSLLCEGGGALGAKLLVEGLVDRLYWIQAPVWLGADAVPAFPGVPAASLAQAPRWVPVERRALGLDTLLVLDRRLCVPES